VLSLREKIDEVEEEEREMASGNGGCGIDIDELSQGEKL
jgi:hypothetical protein